jgi:hypothetical protein
MARRVVLDVTRAEKEKIDLYASAIGGSHKEAVIEGFFLGMVEELEDAEDMRVVEHFEKNGIPDYSECMTMSQFAKYLGL